MTRRDEQETIHLLIKNGLPKSLRNKLRRAKEPYIEASAGDLKGLSHQQMTRGRGFNGSKFGPAGPCRTLSAAERAAIQIREPRNQRGDP